MYLNGGLTPSVRPFSQIMDGVEGRKRFLSPLSLRGLVLFGEGELRRKTPLSLFIRSQSPCLHRPHVRDHRIDSSSSRAGERETQSKEGGQRKESSGMDIGEKCLLLRRMLLLQRVLSSPSSSSWCCERRRNPISPSDRRRESIFGAARVAQITLLPSASLSHTPPQRQQQQPRPSIHRSIAPLRTLARTMTAAASAASALFLGEPG